MMSEKIIGIFLYNPLSSNSTKRVEADGVTTYIVKLNQISGNITCGCICDIIIVDSQFDDDFIYALLPCLKESGKIEFI